jgi:hypothetical protein
MAGREGLGVVMLHRLFWRNSTATNLLAQAGTTSITSTSSIAANQ